MMKKILALVALAMLLTALMIPLAAAATDIGTCYYDPENYTIIDEYCDTEDGCGFLWLKGTYKYRLEYPCTNTEVGHREFYCEGAAHSTSSGDCCAK